MDRNRIIIFLFFFISPLLFSQEEILKDSIKETTYKKNINSSTDPTHQISIGYPVISKNDTLFYIYTGVLNYTPEQRAIIISEKIDELKGEYSVRKDSLKIAPSEEFVDIFFKDQVVLRVTDKEALNHGVSKEVLAKRFADDINNKILIHKEERSLLQVIKQLGISLVVLLVLILLVRLNNRLFRKVIRRKIIVLTNKYLPKIQIKSYEILEGKIVKRMFLFITTGVQYFINLVLLYITLPIIFSIFPDTENIAAELISLVVSPLKTILTSFVEFIPSLITIIIIVAFTHYGIKFLKYIVDAIEQEKLKIPGFYPDWAKTTFSLLRIFIWIFSFIIIFPHLPGSSSDAFQGVSVFIGVIFSLGSTAIIGNLIAGLVITYMRPFLIGDMIKVGDKTGSVVQKTTFAIKIRTAKKELITIPNSTILTSQIVNLSTSNKKGGIVLYSTVTIGYDVPWRKVHEILIDAAKKTNYTLETPEPFVLQTSLDDFYVSYQINVHTDKPILQPRIYSELHQNIQDGFNEAGIEIMSPHYSAARDGNQSTIPEDNLPKDYTAPYFRFLFKNSDK